MSLKTNKDKVAPLIFDTYLVVIKNSVGSKLFRNFYTKIKGKKVDIMRNGELSCAFYVSSVLYLFKYIKGVHGTVDSTIKDLKESGWIEVNKPKIGAVLVWENKISGNDEVHRHIGFFIGRDKAISNISKLGAPAEHSWNFNAKRKVERIFLSPKLK